MKRRLAAAGVPGSECGEVAAGYRIVRGPLPGAGACAYNYKASAALLAGLHGVRPSAPGGCG